MSPFTDFPVMERPEGMTYEAYHTLRAEQTKRLKMRLKGVFAWKSKAVMVMGKNGAPSSPMGVSLGTATRDMIPSVVIR